MHIIFLGMKHCGKSTAGRIVAENFNMKFVDTDDLMSAYYFKKNNIHKTAKEIFAEFGNDFFKEIEYAAINELINMIKDNTCDNFVIALGGATVLNGNIMEKIEQLSPTIIYLKASPERLFPRVVKNGSPRFLNSENPLAEFTKCANEREVIYSKFANFVLDTDFLPTVSSMERALVSQLKPLLLSK